MQAWLAPEDVIAAGRALRTDRDRALGPASLLLGSAELTGEQDGGLRIMVEQLLQRFRIPPEYISLLKNAVGRDGHEYDWDTLETLCFEGIIETPNPPRSMPIATVEIKERSVFFDIIAQPVKGLQGLVAVCAKNWLSLAKMSISPENIFHQHRASEPFVVWMDAEVGRACGFPHLGREPYGREFVGPNNRYRAVTVSNFCRSNSKLLDLVKQAARSQALETWGPIR